MENIKDKSFGVVPIFKDTNGELLFCLVQHQGEHWGFPKGHPDKNESEEETALRELKEETGLKEVQLVQNIFFNENYIFDKDGNRYDKSVKYFLGLVTNKNTNTQDEFMDEITEVKWLSYKEARDLITFENAKVNFDEVWEYILLNQWIIFS
jgi:bis(5'-nucleosidyl)-tetraphosphatase